MSSQNLIALDMEQDIVLAEEILIGLDNQFWIELDKRNDYRKKITEIILKLYPTMFRANYYGELELVSGIPEEDASRAGFKFRITLHELCQKTDTEINQIYEGLANLAADESDGWIFQQDKVNVDVEFWSKMPTWTANEAIVITIGKDPRFINRSYLDKWTKSVVGILGSNGEKFFDLYVTIKNLVFRAEDSGLLVFPTPSLAFIKWIKQFDIDFPQDLAEKVFSYHEEQDFKALHQNSISECEALSEQSENLKLKNKKLQQEKSDIQRQYNSAAKMLTGVANNKFGDDRSKITKIQSALDLEGVSADRKTISEHLDKGSELIKKDSEKASSD